MKYVLFLSLLAAVSIVGVASPPSKPTDIRKPGVYQLKLVVSDKVIARCSITIIPYSHCHDMPAPWAGWGGDLDTSWAKIYSLFREIKLWVGDHEVLVPLSCYGDLVNPDNALLAVIPNGYALEINGADAALSYHATITFDNKWIRSRKVFAGEDPAAWQLTTYHPDTVGIGP